MNKLNKWNKIKQETNTREHVRIMPREIWWTRVGENIGFEQNGKGEEFTRPVLAIRVLNKKMFIGIPMSSSDKNDKSSYYFKVIYEGKEYYALLLQVRLFSTKRLKQLIRMIDKKEFNDIKMALRKLMRI